MHSRFRTFMVCICRTGKSYDLVSLSLSKNLEFIFWQRIRPPERAICQYDDNAYCVNTTTAHPFGYGPMTSFPGRGGAIWSIVPNAFDDSPGKPDVCLYPAAPVADAADDGRRRRAGVRAVQLGRRRPFIPVGGQDGRRARHRQHPRPAGARCAVVRPARHLREADRHVRLRQRVGDGRARVAHHRQPPRAVADRARAADGAGDHDRHRAGACRRLRARLAHGPRRDGRVHGGHVDLDPRLHHRVPVRPRL